MARPSAVRFEERDALGVLTLDRRGTRNRLDDDVTDDLTAILDEVREDARVRCLVVTGAGVDFSVGTRRSAATALHLDLGAREVAVRLAGLQVPTIAAIRGRAFGAGLEIALACDIRVVASDAKLGMPQVREGRLPSAGGTQRLPRLVGRSKAIEMIMLGSIVGGDEAVWIGLANRSVDAREVEAVAFEIAADCLRQAPIAVRYAKEAIVSGMEMPYGEAMRMELDLAILLQSTDDRWEGLASFRERRRPTMRGT